VEEPAALEALAALGCVEGAREVPETSGPLFVPDDCDWCRRLREAR
jgi:hypothetical protein